MSTTQEPASSQADGETSAAAARGPMGFLLASGVAVLLLLGGAMALRSEPPPAPPQDMPQLAVLVEFADLTPETRKAIGALQRGLVKLPKVRVRGPMDCLLLGAEDPDASLANLPMDPSIPPEVQVKIKSGEVIDKKRAALPITGRFDSATFEEFREASQYFAEGGYLVPRMVAPDHKSIILRLAPAGQPKFPAGTLASVRKLLEEHGSAFAGTALYSKSLGARDPAARERINANFGVQTVWVVLESAEAACFTEPVLSGIEAAVRTIDDPRVRTVASDASYFRYGYAADEQKQNSKTPLNASAVESGGKAKKVAPLVFLAKQHGYPLLTSEDRKRTFIEITTTAEGPEALKLERDLAKRFANIPGVKAFANRPGAKASN